MFNFRTLGDILAWKKTQKPMGFATEPKPQEPVPQVEAKPKKQRKPKEKK